MGKFKLGREAYWTYVGVLIAAKLGIVLGFVLAASNAPSAFLVLGFLDDGIAIALVLVVGARFADAGWHRWLGAILTIAAYMAVPLIFLLWELPTTRNLFESLPDKMWIAMVVLFVLLIVAGLKKSAPLAAERPNPEVNTSAA